jgi:hypothetical protein
MREKVVGEVESAYLGSLVGDEEVVAA